LATKEEGREYPCEWREDQLGTGKTDLSRDGDVKSSNET
jgi:hypothetical protein